MKDDTISRAAAIETVRKAQSIGQAHRMLLQLPSAQPNLDEWCDDCKEYDKERHSCPRWNRVIRETVEDMKAAQPGWIPVTEKCPEIGQIVLCSLKTRHYYGRIHVCKYRAADKYYDHSYFDWNHNGFPDVVAWMPLPTPYWEGGQDE